MTREVVREDKYYGRKNGKFSLKKRNSDGRNKIGNQSSD